MGMRNKKIVKINKFDNFDENSGRIKTKMFYNYRPTTILNNTKGFKSATFPTSLDNPTERELKISEAGINHVKGLCHVRQYMKHSGVTADRLLVYADDKKIYMNDMLYEMFDVLHIYSLTFNTAPTVIAYKQEEDDAAILTSEDKMVVWQTGYSPYTIEDVPIITSMCMNDGILFCTIKEPAFKIWYTSKFEIAKFGQVSRVSNYISLEDNLGSCRKVVAFNEEVYVFRDYGISKISLIKNEANISQIYVSNTKIHANTVSVCGNNIFFMTKDGLNSFNGVKVTKANVALINGFPVANEGAVASSLGEKYYLALRLDFEDEKNVLDENEAINNALIIINTTDFSCEIIRGVDIQSMLPLKIDVLEKMLFTFNSGPIDKIGELDEGGALMGIALPKFWASERLVETLETKLFTKLKVYADVGVKFSLIFDDKILEFTTYKTGINEFMFKHISKDARLEISSNQASAVVKDVEIEYYEN